MDKEYLERKFKQFKEDKAKGLFPKKHFIEVVLNNNASIIADDYIIYNDYSLDFFIGGHLSGVCELANIKMLI